MKILHTSDWHVGKSLRGRSRAEEHRAVLAEIAGIAGREGVDLVVVAGDLFDSSAPSPEAEGIVYRALLDLRETGATVVLVAGNHDHPRRLEAVAPLLDLGGLVTAPLLRPADRGGVVRVPTDGGEEAVLALVPFLSKRHIVRADDLMGLDPAQHEQRYAGRMKLIVQALGEALDPGAVNLVVAHLTVTGALPGGGERAAHIFEYAVPASIFDGLGLHYAALGHLHRRQRIPATCPAWYSGSPLQLDFGEEGNEPSILLVEARAEAPAEVEEVELVSGRRLRTVEGTPEELEARREEVGDDYLRVVVHGARRPGLGDEMRELFPQAVDVLVDPPDRDERPSRRITRLGRSPRELFGEYLEEHQASDDRLLALFDELLEEVHEADPA